MIRRSADDVCLPGPVEGGTGEGVGVAECGDGVGVADRGEGLEADNDSRGETIVASSTSVAALLTG
jgi:hypothetical protein